MPRWLPGVLTRIRALAAAGRIAFTDKASAEMQDIGLGRDDVDQILRNLAAGDHPARLRSGPLQELLYSFQPVLAGLRLYLKVAIRTDCVVISCHEDQTEAQEEPRRDD